MSDYSSDDEPMTPECVSVRDDEEIAPITEQTRESIIAQAFRDVIMAQLVVRDVSAYHDPDTVRVAQDQVQQAKDRLFALEPSVQELQNLRNLPVH